MDGSDAHKTSPNRAKPLSALEIQDVRGGGEDQVLALSYWMYLHTNELQTAGTLPLTAFTYKLFFSRRDRSSVPPHRSNRPSFSSTLAAPLHRANDAQPPAANGTPFRLELPGEGHRRGEVCTYVGHVPTQACKRRARYEPSLPAIAQTAPLPKEAGAGQRSGT